MKRTGIFLPALGILAVLAVFADFFSPAPPETLDLQRFFAPPSRVHFIDAEGRFHLRPFIRRYELADPIDIQYVERAGTEEPLAFFCEGYEYRFLGLFPAKRHLAGARGGEGFHPLGTDELGRDVLARVLAGARTSLVVVLAGLCAYAAIGFAVGILSGFAGGWIDALLMRASEFVMAAPALYLILALRALLPPKISYWETVALVAGTIALASWPPMARGIRGLILQLRSAPYVEAARSFGGSRRHILTRHMIPALLPFAASQAVVAAPVFLLGEAVLSFLDIGFQGKGESWGSMLRNVKDPRVLTDFWWNLAPLVMIFGTIFCLTALSRRLAPRGPETQVFRI